jgi:hypothetical protein
MRVKLYYTVGQLSNHAPELFAMKGLGSELLLSDPRDEPFSPPGAAQPLKGMGGDLMGNEWLEEHMVRGYEGGWFTMNHPRSVDEDASIGSNTVSRMVNYYISGQEYLYKSVGVGGLYYDGFGSERIVQQRIRRMSSAARIAADDHAWFDIHGRAFNNVELLPFVDTMWTSEGIDFTRGPHYWLTTISALPFGTFGEMLGADMQLCPNYPLPGSGPSERCAWEWR